MMRNKYLCVLLAVSMGVLGILPKTYGQEQPVPKDAYLASAIPDSLKENANSVLRYGFEESLVTGPGKMVRKVHSIVTVLNEKADREAIMQLYYDKKFMSYSDIVMHIYDAEGKLIKKYHKADMIDFAPLGGGNLITDARYLAVRHTIASYPTTIETEYEVSNNSNFDLGGWEYQYNQQSVQNSYFHLVIDSNAGFRYLSKNTSIKAEKKTIDGKSDYLLQVKNLKAIKLEEGAEDWRVFPHIYFAASKFNVEGYPGDLSTWKTYGQWLKELHDGGNSLTPERTAEIKKMTDSIKTDKAKAAFLYNYMQRNMRYVSVQLGIGGWKPFTATFVDEKKYGDCKALANYMCALLKAVDIQSYCAVINAEANEEPADPSFPFNYFNHEILCVPFKGDTTWLECTSSTQPFGKLGNFTENRNALLITDDGGKLVRTPRSNAADNQFNSEVHLALDADGGAKASVKILTTGEYRRDYIGILSQKLDEQKETVMQMLKIKQPSVFNVNPAADKNGIKEVDLNLEYDKFCDIMAGDKQFYRPRVFDLCAFTVPIEEKRKSDYYFDIPLQKTCVTTIDLPQGFTMETLPVDQSLKFTYGNYEVKYAYDAAKNQVVSTAKFNINNHVIPADKYAEMQQYLDAVAKAQNKKMVIRRKA
jgi:hypothetical protein